MILTHEREEDMKHKKNVMDVMINFVNGDKLYL